MSIYLLALETSTDACSVAVTYNGKIIESYALIPRQHTQNILSMLDELLSRVELGFSQIDAIAFGCGPGSFTGLRIAASVVQALAVAWDRPVIPVSTLMALAQGGYRRLVSCQSAAPSPLPLSRKRERGNDVQANYIFSALDARMGEVYGGFYQLSETEQVMSAFSEEFLKKPSEIEFPENIKWVGVGSGCRAFLPIFQQQKAFIWHETSEEIYPSAYDVAELALRRFQKGQFVSAEEALPVYFRDGVV